jgi:VWFA-related protein
LLTNFSPDELTVYDDAQAVPSFTTFAASSDLPLRVGLLVDRSDSVRKGFAAEQEAARQFLRKVLRPGTDSIFLLDFTHQLDFHEAVPGNLELIANQVNSLAAGGQTALYDAVYAATRRPAMTASEPEPVRRSIILLSDGEDTCSLHGLEDAIQAAQRDDVSIYAITVHSSREVVRGDEVLRALAEGTGGRAFVLNNLKEIGAVFGEIQAELRSEYAVAFRLPAPERCGFHTLRIEAHNPHLTVRARQGYFACRP